MTDLWRCRQGNLGSVWCREMVWMHVVDVKARGQLRSWTLHMCSGGMLAERSPGHFGRGLTRQGHADSGCRFVSRESRPPVKQLNRTGTQHTKSKKEHEHIATPFHITSHAPYSTPHTNTTNMNRHLQTQRTQKRMMFKEKSNENTNRT